jgi:TRAP transporter 4TM/12TM fusion protein
LTALVSLAYAWMGPLLDLVGLGALAHRGYPLDRLVGILYMTLDGLFGVPLEVAATYIILFAIYGAVLEASGAGRFFLDWTLAALARFRSGAAPGRAVAVAGFLLGTVSGSGVATTLTLGSMAWPLLRRAGYTPEVAGGILSAAGIGAILSPPTLGAAAFLIAEFLDIHYLQVLVMATVPTLLYYLSILVVVEGDALRLHAQPVRVDVPSVWTLTRRYGYHFLSLAIIPALMIYGLTTFATVFWATLLAAALSYWRRETAITSRRAFEALSAAGRSVVGITATTACAGIIVGVVALTGLGLKLAGLIVALAGGSAVLTVACASVAIWMVGLALPVTASYIIAAVMIAPALVRVGVPTLAAHMFIFYYAVLSEVSPPTALSPFAAAGLTGGNPYRTMIHAWRYTLPAFVVPWIFALTPDGLGLLLQAPLAQVVRSVVISVVGMTALSAAVGGRLVDAATRGERAAATGAGLLLLVSRPWSIGLGGVTLLATVMAHARRVRRDQPARVAPESSSARISSS